MSRMQMFGTWVAVLAAMLVTGAAFSTAFGAGARDLDETWKHAIEAGDLEGVVACYADDATLWLPGDAEAHGRDAIREAYRGLLAANKVSDVRYSDTRYFAGGAIEGGAGHFALLLTPKAGGDVTRLEGRFSTLVRHEHGRWVYEVDHASTGPKP